MVSSSKRGSLFQALAAGIALLVVSASYLPAAETDLRLIEAAKGKNKAAVQSLLKEKVNVNAAQPDGTTALTWAVHWDDMETADLLLKAGANPNAANEYGVTPLSLAITNRNTAMAARLLDAKANPNASMWSGETPLMTAASVGNIEIAKQLLDHGANVNAKENKRGQTALMWAIADGHPDIAKLLIERGADIKTKTQMPSGFNPMIFEAYGSDVNATPAGGYTPLLFAARVGDLETAKLLISKGAEVNDATKDDGNTLVVAAAGGFQDLALFLLDKGADAKSKDSSGLTALHYAMRDGLKVLHSIDIYGAKRVCGAGAGARCTAGDVDENNPAFADVRLASGNYDRNPDSILPGRNMPLLAKALLDHGADPNAQINEPPPRLRLRHKPTLNLSGATPFLLAAAAGDLNSMKILAEGHAKPLVGTVVNPKEFNKPGFGDDNQIQGNGTSLMVAVGMGRHDDFSPREEKNALEAARTLVDMGADVNQTTETGWTALHAASFGGATSIVEFLISKGANVNAVNGCGQTPYSLAAGTNARGLLERVTPHKATAELIKKAGGLDKPQGKAVGKCVEGRYGLEYATVDKLEDAAKTKKEKAQGEQ